jgi:hypothetical protein
LPAVPRMKVLWFGHPHSGTAAEDCPKLRAPSKVWRMFMPNSGTKAEDCPMAGGHLPPEQTPILLVSNVTAPVRAYSPQFDDAPVVAVMEISARMLPMKLVPVPKVAELPTCQKTLAAVAPLISNTFALLAVIRVLPIWKMKTPLPLRVRFPVKKAEEAKQYTPGVRVRPPRSWPVKLVLHAWLAAFAYAVCASACAVAATASPACIVPVTIPGPPVQGAGNPVHAVPGLTPRLPVKTVGPVFVTVWAPITAKVPAVPRGGADAAGANAAACTPVAATARVPASSTTVTRVRTNFDLRTLSTMFLL